MKALKFSFTSLLNLVNRFDTQNSYLNTYLQLFITKFHLQLEIFKEIVQNIESLCHFVGHG